MRSKASQPRRRPLFLFLPVSVRLLRWVDVLVLRPLRPVALVSVWVDREGGMGREGSSSCSCSMEAATSTREGFLDFNVGRPRGLPPPGRVAAGGAAEVVGEVAASSEEE